MWGREGGKKRKEKNVSDGSPGTNRMKELDQRLLALSWQQLKLHCFIKGACAGAVSPSSKFPQGGNPSVPGSERVIFAFTSQLSPLKTKVLSGHSGHLFFTAILSSWHGWTFVKINRFCRQVYIRKILKALSIAQETVICIARLFNFMLLHSHLQYNLQRCSITIIFSHYIQWKLQMA